MSSVIREVKDGSDFAIAMAIRMEVFVREQGVPLEREMDDLDQTATHYLATKEGAPAAVARTRVADGVGYIERVAVRKEHRGSGIGQELMQHLIARLRNHPQAKTIAISAQEQALPFYEKLGFVAEGDTYLDADIPHRKMIYAS